MSLDQVGVEEVAAVEEAVAQNLNQGADPNLPRVPKVVTDLAPNQSNFIILYHNVTVLLLNDQVLKLSCLFSAVGITGPSPDHVPIRNLL